MNLFLYVKANTGFEGLIENAHSIENLFDKDVVIEKPSLEDIMYFMKKGIQDA